MRTIWKYKIPVTDEFTISMPQDAKILAVQVQYETPVIWAVVDTDKPDEDVKFKLYGTGQPDINTVDTMYVGTFQLFDGGFVGHLFIA